MPLISHITGLIRHGCTVAIVVVVVVVVANTIPIIAFHGLKPLGEGSNEERERMMREAQGRPIH